jgi:hypothetical protein
LKTLSLFTFICEYAGGTYVSQTHAASEIEAVDWWIENLKCEKFIPKVSTVIAEKFRQAVDGEDTVEFYLAPLNGLKNTWQFGDTFFDSELYTTVVKTEQ